MTFAGNEKSISSNRTGQVAIFRTEPQQYCVIDICTVCCSAKKSITSWVLVDLIIKKEELDLLHFHFHNALGLQGIWEHRFCNIQLLMSVLMFAHIDNSINTVYTEKLHYDCTDKCKAGVSSMPT